jgi:hypothetical protein
VESAPITWEVSAFEEFFATPGLTVTSDDVESIPKNGEMESNFARFSAAI